MKRRRPRDTCRYWRTSCAAWTYWPRSAWATTRSIRGSAIVGKKAVVGNSTELKNVVLFDEVQVPHYNYVGDSILGHKAHMGAGSITSNVKSDKKLVVIHNGEEQIPTGRKKVGAILGDNVEVGCNTVLNPRAPRSRRASGWGRC